MRKCFETANSPVRIALTMGDPAGIGPELAVKAATAQEFRDRAKITVYGAPEIIAEAARRFCSGAPVECRSCSQLSFADVMIGRENAACGRAAYDSVVAACTDVLEAKADAIVTAPMNKASVNLAGIPFSGHTELIAEMCHCDDFAMMQSDGDLRVAFVTTHIPLAEVNRAVTEKRIIKVAKLLNDSIRADGIENPKIGVAAVNPHAGENGYMGLEEQKTVIPALEKLRADGIDAYGPFPPDTLFIERIRKRFDGILSMYHDQGHIPFKMLAFDRGVNSTLGLPIIRTSVDHGTAFEIAWQGVADTTSMFAAMKTAIARAGFNRGCTPPLTPDTHRVF